MTPAHSKQALREQAKAIRDDAAAQLGDDGIRRFFEHLIQTWSKASEGFGNETIMAGYWPMASEMDVRPALVALDRIEVLITLPEVSAKDRPLRFRAWRPDEALIEGDHGTFHPLKTAPLMRPDVVLVPLLAFDRRGYRIGWGGGYYDRTLELLRKPVNASPSAWHIAPRKLTKCQRMPMTSVLIGSSQKKRLSKSNEGSIYR